MCNVLFFNIQHPQESSYQQSKLGDHNRYTGLFTLYNVCKVNNFFQIKCYIDKKITK